MSILIEQSPVLPPIPSVAPALSGLTEQVAGWRSPARGSIIALDAADAFAALLHHRIMAEATRIERAVGRDPH